MEGDEENVEDEFENEVQLKINRSHEFSDHQRSVI